MFAERPVIELEKAPIPDPFDVLLSDRVGFRNVLQHTPRAVTVKPPFDVTSPPEAAVGWVIGPAAVVVTAGPVKTKPVPTNPNPTASVTLVTLSVVLPLPAAVNFTRARVIGRD